MELGVSGNQQHGGHRPPQLTSLAFDAPTDEIIAAVRRDGGAVLGGAISTGEVQSINDELDTALAEMQKGSLMSDPNIKAFHGSKTKRLGNVISLSPTYRERFVDRDETHAMISSIFAGVCDTFWLQSCQAIEIHPGEKRQVLHRDMGTYPVFYRYADCPEVTCNMLLALCDVSEEIGATRIIPGSHTWDFSREARQEDTVPAVLKAGSVLFYSGKLLHGGGANETVDRRRRVVATSFCPGFLVPEEAYPFIVPLEQAKTMSKRLQQMLGFRSIYQRNPRGGSLWQHNFEELAFELGLEVRPPAAK